MEAFKIILMAVLILIILYATVCVLLAYKFAFMILKPPLRDYDFQLNKSLRLNRFTKEYINSLDIEAFEVKSRYGYTLKGIIQNNDISKLPENRTKVAVLCHGFTSANITMSGYAKMLLEMGFTCVMYDHRHHGETGDVGYTSMGYYEKFDLQTVLDYCNKRYGDDIRILTYGESMGSATILGLLEIDSRPVLTIADCGFSSFYKLSEILLHGFYKVPKFFPIIPIANIIISRKGHFLIEQVNPIEGVKRAKCPILFCHGANDNFIPCSMSEEMSKVGPGVREIYLCPGADHALSEITKPEEYIEKVTAFIKTYY